MFWLHMLFGKKEDRKTILKADTTDDNSPDYSAAGTAAGVAMRGAAGVGVGAFVSMSGEETPEDE
jgi:hypothetical protein